MATFFVGGVARSRAGQAVRSAKNDLVRRSAVRIVDCFDEAPGRGGFPFHVYENEKVDGAEMCFGHIVGLADLGVRLVGQVALEDHVAYTPAVLARIAEAAQAADAPLLLTTEKDAVKLTGKDLGLPLWRLAVEMEITEGRDELLRLIDEVSGLPSGRP